MGFLGTELKTAGQTIVNTGASLGDAVGDHLSLAYHEPGAELGRLGGAAVGVYNGAVGAVEAVYRDPLGVATNAGKGTVNYLDRLTTDPTVSGEFLGNYAIDWALAGTGGYAAKFGGRTISALKRLPEVPGAPRGPLRADADVLRDVFGPARLSHSEEYVETLARLRRADVEIDFRPGNLAYSPRPGGPGRLILDPDASIGALRHEVRHFVDIAEGGYKGLGHYYDNLDEFWRLEYRGYMEEIGLARQAREFGAGREILKQMRARRQELLGH